MNSDFPFQEYEQVRSTLWLKGEYVTITAIGRDSFLGLPGGSQSNTPERKYDFTEATWEKYKADAIATEAWLQYNDDGTVATWRLDPSSREPSNYGQYWKVKIVPIEKVERIAPPS